MYTLNYYARTHTHTHSHARTHALTRMHARTHTHTHTCTCTRTHTHTHTHTAHIQSLGETHVDLSPAAALPPVPPLAGESRDSSHDPQTISVVSHVHDPQGSSQLVLKDGDIRDDVIEDIVAQATSSSSSSEDEVEDTTGESHLQTKCFMSTLWAYRKIGSGHSLGKLGPNYV